MTKPKLGVPKTVALFEFCGPGAANKWFGWLNALNISPRNSNRNRDENWARIPDQQIQRCLSCAIPGSDRHALGVSPSVPQRPLALAFQRCQFPYIRIRSSPIFQLAKYPHQLPVHAHSLITPFQYRQETHSITKSQFQWVHLHLEERTVP